MEKPVLAVAGIGATGVVLAAALLSKDPDVLVVDPQPGLAETLARNGPRVSGEIAYQVPVKQVFSTIEELKDHRPDVVFVATKTFHLPRVLEGLEAVFRPGMKIVSTHNGLGTEDVIADCCFQEAMAVAKAKGYDLGADYLKEALAYLEKVGVHKDSMCFDVANQSRTEIDFLGGKVVEYGRETGVPTPCYSVMTNLVRDLENKYL
ncbi:MAG: ketopantoate reductase C-terminal domain-containing protein [Desulfatiglandaceae bacterium]